MKLWRKMGNKVTLTGAETPLTGRQFKYRQQMLSGMKDIGSSLLQTLVAKTPYVSPYVKEEK